MFFRRALTHTISRRTQATKNMGKPALRFTYNEGRIQAGKQFEVNPDLSLPGAFFLFTVAPMLAFDVFAICFAN